MYKRKVDKTSDRLVIFTILTTLTVLVFGFISEHSKNSKSDSSFADELSSTTDSNKAAAPAQAAEAPASTATAPTETAEPQEVIQAEITEAVVAPTTGTIEPTTSATTTANTVTANGGYNHALTNGNSAGAVGSSAAAQMAAATGVDQATWEYIIARESNGNPNVANGSGASGLFQTMPGWGSTATVQDQVNSAINAYNAQGMSAWGM